jgi:sulfite exporter TauE/SafE
MLAFGLGTLPMMFALTLVGRKLQLVISLNFQRLIPVSLALMGLAVDHAALRDYDAMKRGDVEAVATVHRCLTQTREQLLRLAQVPKRSFNEIGGPM